MEADRVWNPRIVEDWSTDEEDLWKDKENGAAGTGGAPSRVGEIITYGQNFPAVFDMRILGIYRVAQLEEPLNEKNFHSARHRALITFSNLP